MSRDLDTWYSLPDLDHLARLGEPRAGELALAKLTRLAGLLSSPGGAVNASVSVQSRAGGSLELALECSAEVELICQRCLEPMTCMVAGAVRYEVFEEGQSERRDEDQTGLEHLVLDGGRVNLAHLIEEELIVSLPLAPRHEDKAACGNLARTLENMSIEVGNDPKDAAVNH